MMPLTALSALLIQPVFWNWLILFSLFLLLELLSSAFFFLFWAAAALLMTLLTLSLPALSWPAQLIWFSLFSLLCIAAWWFFLVRNWQKNKQDIASRLNNRGKNLIGRKYRLQTPILNGSGRLQIDDSMWMICGEDMPAGSIVEIVAVDSLELDVRRVA